MLHLIELIITVSSAQDYTYTLMHLAFCTLVYINYFPLDYHKTYDGVSI